MRRAGCGGQSCRWRKPAQVRARRLARHRCCSVLCRSAPMEQLRDHEIVYASPGGTKAYRGQRPKNTSRSSFHFLSLCGAISMALLIPVMMALRTITCASEYGVSTYRPGLIDLFSGLLGPPGTTLVKSLFLF